MKKYFHIISFVLLVLLSACKKEDELIPVAKIAFNDTYIADYKSVDLCCTVKSNVTIESLNVEYSTSKDMSGSKQVEMLHSKDDNYSATINDLQIQTEYYYRFIVENKVSEYFDDKKRTFKTLEYTSPIVVTHNASNISGTKATLSGTIEFACDKPILEQGFQIGTTEMDFKEYKVDGQELIYLAEGLDYKTTYYYRAYAKNEIGKGLGEIKTFETCSAVSFNDITVSSITANNATINAGIFDNGGIELEIQGVRYAIKGSEEYAFVETSGSVNLSSLLPDTTYEVWGYAKTFEGEFEGKRVEFKTMDGKVLITTSSPINVTTSSATLKGSISSDGGSKIVERGFCYATNDPPTVNDIKIKIDGETGEYESQLTNLPQNVKYFVRAYAINEVGTYYGESISFTTLYDSATFGKITSSDITASSISVSCTITSNGGSTIILCGFCYSTYKNPTIDDNVVVVSDSKTNLNTTIKGLKSGVTYYIRAFATNSNSTFYSDEISFVTCEGIVQFTDPTTSNVAAASIIVSSQVLSAGGGTISERGFCYSTAPNPTTENDKVKSSGTLGEFTATLNNLQNKTIYYIRAYAINESGTYYSKEVEGKTQDGVATLSTDEATNVMAQSATINGSVLSDGGSNITERGFCYATTEHPTVESTVIKIDGTIGEMSHNITGLKHLTTYYVRTYAKNGYGIHYGNQRAVTTSSGVIEFNEITTSDITISSITVSTDIISDGNSAITQRGFCYSTSSEPTVADNKVIISGTTGKMSGSISGLNNGQKYYIRSFATNAIGTQYSEQISFTSLTGLADVSTSVASNVMAETATLNGEVISDNGGTISSRGFCYGSSKSPTVNDVKIVDNGNVGHMSITASELSANTLYYYRAFATTQFGTTYGEEFNFTTLDGVVMFSSVNSTNLLANSVDVTATIATNGGSSIIEKGFCYSTSSIPTIHDKKIAVKESSNNLTCTLMDLECATTYYIRSYAINNIGTYYSDLITITTDTGIPTIDILTVNNIKQTTVDVSCSVIDNGGSEILCRGFCYSTTPNPSTSSNRITIDGQIGVIQCTIDNLISDQDYYIKAFVQTKHYTTYSNEISIHTIAGLGTITDASVVNVRETEATLSANLISMGGSSVNTLGYCYSTKSNPTITDYIITVTPKLGSFNVDIDNLEQNTTYYARPYAITEYGISYGVEVSFTTTYYPVTFGDITATPYIKSANVKCFILSDGDNSITEHGICYSTGINPSINDNKLIMLEDDSMLIPELVSGNKYYARRYATNRIGTFYSEQIEFTTLVAPDGAIQGVFSISETERVFFSKGNLILENETYRFADNQYDYLGSYTIANSQTLKNPRDFFHPKNDFDAISNATISNTSSENWGLLTRDEWNYILNKRNIPSYTIYIDGLKIQGRLILPDGWVAPNNAVNLTESQNVISLDEIKILESAGALFLPSAGQGMYHEYLNDQYRHFVKNLGFSSCHYYVKDPSYSYTYYKGIPDAISSAYVYDVANKYAEWIDVHYNRAGSAGTTSYIGAVRLIKRIE